MTTLSEGMVMSKARVGTLENLKNLNFWGNELADISIINRMPCLEVVSLSVNSIRTLKDFASCPNLAEIYIRKNEIADLSELHWLQGLSKLRTLWLSHNPCADQKDYRLKVIKMLPQLTKLDNLDITDEERDHARSIVFSPGKPSDAPSNVPLLVVGPNSGKSRNNSSGDDFDMALMSANAGVPPPQSARGATKSPLVGSMPQRPGSAVLPGGNKSPDQQLQIPSHPARRASWQREGDAITKSSEEIGRAAAAALLPQDDREDESFGMAALKDPNDERPLGINRSKPRVSGGAAAAAPSPPILAQSVSSQQSRPRSSGGKALATRSVIQESKQYAVSDSEELIKQPGRVMGTRKHAGVNAANAASSSGLLSRSKSTNVLRAVLLLISDLDEDSLQVVKNEVDTRLLSTGNTPRRNSSELHLQENFR